MKPLVTGRKRRYKLPPTTINQVDTGEDLGAPEIEVQIAGCLIRRVPVDGGSGVNIMIADTAQALGFTHFESTPKFLRMADQSRVVPVGILMGISVVIGDKPFRLTFIILEPSTPSSYPMLLGRPWLYRAQVNTSWGKKTFTFGNPKTTITWETIVHQGETSGSDTGYTSDESMSTVDSQWLEVDKGGDTSSEDSEALNLLSLFKNETEVDDSPQFEENLQTGDLEEDWRTQGELADSELNAHSDLHRSGHKDSRTQPAEEPIPQQPPPMDLSDEAPVGSRELK